MNINDYNRLFGMLPKKGYVGPAEPISELTRERCKLLTRIVGITTDTSKTDGGRGGSSASNGYSPDSLKCYRLDKQRDIVGDKIYINGNGKPGNTLLSAEMAAAAAGEDIGLELCKDAWGPEFTTWPASMDDISLMNDPLYNSPNGFTDLEKLKQICNKDDRCQGILKFKNNQTTLYGPVKNAGVIGTASPDERWTSMFPEHTIMNKIKCAPPTVKPGDIERILGIIVGVLLGLLLCAVVAYYVLKWTNTNYLDVLKLYGKTTPQVWTTSVATATTK